MSVSAAKAGDINSRISTLLARELSGSHSVALATAQLLLRYVAALRFSHLDELIREVRALGRQIVAAQPRELSSGNVIRRVLALIREVSGETRAKAKNPTGSISTPQSDPSVVIPNSSMFSLLSEEQEPTAKAALSSSSSSSSSAPTAGGKKDAKADIIEGIQELIDEINNMDDTIAGMSVEMIHENEVLLTPTPGSKTVLEFLLRASQKRKFTVLVVECYPNDIETSHTFAKQLSKAGIETIIIPDTTTLSIMSRVGKVIIGARSVLANGSCISSAGVALVCQCARQYTTPVLAVTGLYKLSPFYPYDIESLIEVGNTGNVVDFSDGDLVDKVQSMNPTYDYVPPEHIDIFITNIGGYSPSFTYRIVLDHYNEKDRVL